MLSNCSLTGTWVDEGNLPLPTGYSGTLERTYGYQEGSSSSQWAWDGTLMHAAFLLESSAGSSYYHAVDWAADPTDVDLCN